MIFVTVLSFTSVYTQTPEENLKALGITLPEPKEPAGTYVSWRKAGNMLYIAGIGCRCDLRGKVGTDLTIEQGNEAARLAGINIITTIKQAIGDLSKIKQFIRVHGMVNSAPDFYEQPKVINGFSDLMVKVFGEKGLHARASVGQFVLPGNTPVEIEVTVELEGSN